jgi:antitoxin YefM
MHLFGVRNPGYAADEETRYLLQSPANGRRLLDAIAEIDRGGGESHELTE